MEWFLTFAAAHHNLFTVVGAFIAALSALVLVIAFPVDHQEPPGVAANPIGDGGIGYAASFVRKWGWRRVAIYLPVPIAGVALGFLPYLAPMLLAAN